MKSLLLSSKCFRSVIAHIVKEYCRILKSSKSEVAMVINHGKDHLSLFLQEELC